MISKTFKLMPKQVMYIVVLSDTRAFNGEIHAILRNVHTCRYYRDGDWTSYKHLKLSIPLFYTKMILEYYLCVSKFTVL